MNLAVLLIALIGIGVMGTAHAQSYYDIAFDSLDFEPLALTENGIAFEFGDTGHNAYIVYGDYFCAFEIDGQHTTMFVFAGTTTVEHGNDNCDGSSNTYDDEGFRLANGTDATFHKGDLLIVTGEIADEITGGIPYLLDEIYRETGEVIPPDTVEGLITQQREFETTLGHYTNLLVGLNAGVEELNAQINQLNIKLQILENWVSEQQ